MSEEVSARTRIVLSPAQFFTVIALVVGAAFWMRSIGDSVKALQLDVADIVRVQGSMLSRLDAVDPPTPPPLERRPARRRIQS